MKKNIKSLFGMRSKRRTCEKGQSLQNFEISSQILKTMFDFFKKSVDST